MKQRHNLSGGLTPLTEKVPHNLSHVGPGPKQRLENRLLAAAAIARRIVRNRPSGALPASDYDRSKATIRIFTNDLDLLGITSNVVEIK